MRANNGEQIQVSTMFQKQAGHSFTLGIESHTETRQVANQRSLLGFLATRIAMTIWNEETARARCKKSVEVCERFFAERYGGNHPESANGQAFYDLCLAEYEVRKHLLTVDCFSSRETLLAELKRLLTNPVIPTSLTPCRADQYLECQKKDIEVEIYNLTLEENPHEKPWFQRLFGRRETS